MDTELESIGAERILLTRKASKRKAIEWNSVFSVFESRIGSSSLCL